MKRSSVVFELTDGEIRAFWFSDPPGPFSIKHGKCSTSVKFDSIPIPTGIIEQGNVRNERVLIDSLSTYRSQLPGDNQKAYLAISLQQGFIRAYSLPWLSKRDRTSAVALLVDEEISISRSDLLYDFLVVSEERHIGSRILLGATRQSILVEYVSIFEQAGFKVNGINFAFSVLGQTLKLKPNEDVLYLQGEAGCFQMALFRGEVPEIVRSLPPPLTDELNYSERMQIEEGEKEIRRFLLYYKTQQTALDLKRLVWSGDLVTEKLAQELVTSNHFTLAEPLKLKCVPDSWQKLLEEYSGRSEVVMGYGQLILAHHPVLNLWSQPTRVKKIKRRYIRLAFLTGAILVVGTILWITLEQTSVSLKHEVQLLSHQGSEIEEQVKEQEALETTWNTLRIRREKVGEALNEMQTLSGSEIKIEQMVYKQGSISLSGISSDASSVQTLIHTLRTMGWEQPVLTSYKLTSLNEVKFMISAKRKVAH